MEQELKEKELLLEALMLHRLTEVVSDQQSILREEMIESLTIEIVDLKYELEQLPY